MPIWYHIRITHKKAHSRFIEGLVVQRTADSEAANSEIIIARLPSRAVLLRKHILRTGLKPLFYLSLEGGSTLIKSSRVASVFINHADPGL